LVLMNRKSRQKSAVSASQGLGSEGANHIQELDFTKDLEATKEIILREAEYILAVLSEDRGFWDAGGDSWNALNAVRYLIHRPFTYL